MLIAQMVGRNESDRHLERVLKRLKSQVDLICFTDDCSDDDTQEIAASLGAETTRTPVPMFTVNEGNLRTLAWHHLEKFAEEDDWILCIDCDEELYPTDNFDKLLRQDHYSVLGVTFYHMWNESEYRIDKAWTPNVSSRLFRYTSGGVFRNRKLACGSEPTYVLDRINKGGFLPNSGLRMKHLGYERDEDKTSKYKRYAELDGGMFHAGAHIESINDTDPVLVRWTDEL